jgi:hypothetical protein
MPAERPAPLDLPVEVRHDAGAPPGDFTKPLATLLLVLARRELAARAGRNEAARHSPGEEVSQKRESEE